VNPSHLFLGSNLDNLQDAVLKGRTARGEKHSQAVLTEIDAARIIDALGEGKSPTRIARELGIDRYLVSDISIGKSWIYLKRPDGMRAPRLTPAAIKLAT